ncbi:GNAT family N-acetyltransferase [Methylopila sp. Yamaguchi]|uniref:GNAT family N-acetyltransferase n=1 Tax=Methylopila sp. Yamaguchi TaxID=1437817 RepID=UPI000CC8DE6D|nr:GNAT family N-acetyltransferase [Methylopila sp. Yamaguchi]GBD49526.1 N-acetyltransferase GCN5 [Methylopila sp. Yamaguchi]
MTDVLIREATDADGPALGDLIASVFAELEGKAFDAEAIPGLDRPASYYAERGGRMWVMASGEAILGALALEAHHRPNEFEIDKLYFAKETRGQGFAAALLAGAEAFAAASGGGRLSLWMDSRFEEGRAFCERHGFLRLPGVRALHDANGTLQHHYARDVAEL